MLELCQFSTTLALILLIIQFYTLLLITITVSTDGEFAPSNKELIEFWVMKTSSNLS